MKETELADARSTLPTDIAKTLTSLDTLLSHPQSLESTAALRTHVAALSSWGEALGMDAFVTLSKATMTLLRLSPSQMPLILQLALSGYHAVYELESYKGQITHLLDQRQPETLALPKGQRGSLRPDPDGILKTSNLFVWETGNFVFMLPAAGVAEILIPKSGQISQSQPYRGLQWRNQLIPIYTLVQRPGEQPCSTRYGPYELSRRSSTHSRVRCHHAGDYPEGPNP